VTILATVDPTAKLADAQEVLSIRALIRAFLEYEHQFEHLADVVDPLQEFAELSGLVDAIGQDEVQRLISAPFARFRAIVAAEVEAEERALLEAEPGELTGFDDGVTDIVRRLELADPRDRWKQTGEAPPPVSVRNSDIATNPNAPRSYRTPQSTIDAFWYVVGLDDLARLAAWLDDHPRDKPTLLKLLESK
jgi:hypothetical protein